MRTPGILALLLASLTCAGCIHRTQTGPADTGVTLSSARSDLEELEQHPVPVRRPIVVLSGYHTISWHAGPLADKVMQATSGNEEDVLLISYPGVFDIDEVVQVVIDEVEARWPSSAPDQTTEVDVIGVSMGGIIARWAALPPRERTRAGDVSAGDNPTAKRLKMARLFTYASPHRGASLARYIAPDAAARDLKPGSALLATLDLAWHRRAYELVCYAHTHDVIVGATNTAPPGMDPIWTDGTLAWSHLAVVHNPIFIADTARRLRGDTPLLHTSGPPPRD